MIRSLIYSLLGVALTSGSCAFGAEMESVRGAMCRLIDDAARSYDIPKDFLTRLIWRESSFRAKAISSAGALGVAQFMPGTARDRGLQDPFDPAEAIPAAAKLLSDLRGQFGNLGLAAAAYNGGPGRVSQWLSGTGSLFTETRTYVLFVTGKPVEDWAASRTPVNDSSPSSCLAIVAELTGRDRVPTASAFAPWGVQLAANFSRQQAMASFRRARANLERVAPEGEPMIIGTRLRTRGTRPFYRVRLPQPTRLAATTLCDRIRVAGGSCVVLPSR